MLEISELNTFNLENRRRFQGYNWQWDMPFFFNGGSFHIVYETYRIF